MILDNIPLAKTVVLIDTNAIIEAVRTETWNALTGGMLIETVEECRAEALRGDPTRPSYIAVSVADIGRMNRVHAVSDLARAEYLLGDPHAVGMDGGEQDLFAHAFQRAKSGDTVWVVCSPDKASIRAAVRELSYRRWRSPHSPVSIPLSRAVPIEVPHGILAGRLSVSLATAMRTMLRRSETV